MNTKLAQLSDIPDGGAIVREASDGQERMSVLLTRIGLNVRAFRNLCPHARYPLERFDGTVLMSDGFVLCAAHAASFDPATGRCVGGPAAGKSLAKVAIRLVGADVYLVPAVRR